MIQGQGEATTIAIPPVPPVPPTGQVIVQAPMPPTLPPWVTLPPGITLVIALGFFAACAVVLRPLMTALGRRLEGRSAADDSAMKAELEHLRQRLEELETNQHRLLELEERVDFAERLLTAQRRESERLPGA